MSSRGGRVKRVAQRTREWVRQTAPTLDSDSDILSLASSSDEEDSDIEIERKKSLDKPSASSREKSPEYGTGGLVDNETVTSEAEDSDKEDKSSILASEDVLEEDEEDEDEDDEDSDFISERGEGGFPGFKQQDKQKKIAKRKAKASPSSASNASTGRGRLDWDLIGRVDLKYQHIDIAEDKIEKIMRQEMIVAGNVRIITTTDGQTRAGWKRRLV